MSWVALIYWTAQCAHLIFIQQLLCMLHKCIYWDVRIYVSTVWLHFLFLLLRYSACTLVFGCCLVESRDFFSSWERKNWLQRWANSQNDIYFHSKWTLVVFLSKNGCHFVNLLSLARSSFFQQNWTIGSTCITVYKDVYIVMIQSC